MRKELNSAHNGKILFHHQFTGEFCLPVRRGESLAGLFGDFEVILKKNCRFLSLHYPFYTSGLPVYDYDV